MSALTDFSATAIDSADVDLSTYAGQVVLVVNWCTPGVPAPEATGVNWR